MSQDATLVRNAASSVDIVTSDHSNRDARSLAFADSIGNLSDTTHLSSLSIQAASCSVVRTAPEERR